MKEKNKTECKDLRCPFHGNLGVRGRHFNGMVKKIIGRRAVIEFERPIYYRKYERYASAKTRLHAHIPACLKEKIVVGSSVEIGECRPLSKIMHFVIIKMGEEK
jgi:small subunit ribosomal protein S17